MFIVKSQKNPGFFSFMYLKYLQPELEGEWGGWSLEFGGFVSVFLRLWHLQTFGRISRFPSVV